MLILEKINYLQKFKQQGISLKFEFVKTPKVAMWIKKRQVILELIILYKFYRLKVSISYKVFKCLWYY